MDSRTQSNPSDLAVILFPSPLLSSIYCLGFPLVFCHQLQYIIIIIIIIIIIKYAAY